MTSFELFLHIILFVCFTERFELVSLCIKLCVLQPFTLKTVEQSFFFSSEKIRKSFYFGFRFV